MQCSRFEEQLSDYLDGTLAKGGGAEFREHALQCRACRALMDEVKGALNHCRQGDTVDVPVMLESSLLTIAEQHRAFDCAAFEEIITEFLDGFVPAATYHQFEEHAAGCAGCSDLLTNVVFAVAACHSVHTYEEVELPAPLLDKLISLGPSVAVAHGRRLAATVSAWAARLLPRATAAPRWSMATAASIALASFMFLLYGFSDDRTVAGIYRQAQNKFAQIYTRSADLYAQKEALAAHIERVGMGLDEIWDGLGGERPAGNSPDRQKDADKPQPPQKD
ncbi:MAG TPA: anti-sigma factor [Blastocatellia bacterium]|nr:anti-sigma factor [Blastocatellia bacterium]